MKVYSTLKARVLGCLLLSFLVLLGCSGKKDILLQKDIVEKKEVKAENLKPDLSITQTAPRIAARGGEFTCSIEVRNVGSSTATNVIVTYSLLSLEFKEASEGGQYKEATRTVEWNLGTLRVGESRNLSLRVKLRWDNLDPSWKNTSKVICAEGITKQAETVTFVECPISYGETAYDTEDPVQIGDTTVYVFPSRNWGWKDATHVQMKVRIPDQSSFVSLQAVTGEEVGSVTIDGYYDVASRTVIFDPVPVMHPGDSATYKVEVRAEEAGDVVCTGVLTFAEFSKEVLMEEPTKFYK